MKRPIRIPGRRARQALVVGLLAAVLGPLAGCAYVETMNERNTEGERLRREFEYEQERGRQLRR